MTDLELVTDEAQRALDFVLNRLEGIADQVIDWMPEEDNEVHHNAVEQLQRAFVVTRTVRSQLRDALGYREDSSYFGAVLLGDLTDRGGYAPVGRPTTQEHTR